MLGDSNCIITADNGIFLKRRFSDISIVCWYGKDLGLMLAMHVYDEVGHLSYQTHPLSHLKGTSLVDLGSYDSANKFTFIQASRR